MVIGYSYQAYRTQIKNKCKCYKNVKILLKHCKFCLSYDGSSLSKPNPNPSPVSRGNILVTMWMFSHRILGITDGITNLVGLKWDLLATLIIAWGIVYLIICKGLHASGKVYSCIETLTGLDRDEV